MIDYHKMNHLLMSIILKSLFIHYFNFKIQSNLQILIILNHRHLLY